MPDNVRPVPDNVRPVPGSGRPAPPAAEPQLEVAAESTADGRQRAVDAALRELATRGVELDAGVVSLAAAGLDVHVETQKLRSRIDWELWDGETPINGVPAERIKARADWVGGAAYLIRVDGQITGFQPHPREGMKPMTEAEARDLAAVHVAELAASVAEDAVAQRIVASLADAGLAPADPQPVRPTTDADDAASQPVSQHEWQEARRLEKEQRRARPRAGRIR